MIYDEETYKIMIARSFYPDSAVKIPEPKTHTNEKKPKHKTSTADKNQSNVQKSVISTSC